MFHVKHYSPISTFYKANKSFKIDQIDIGSLVDLIFSDNKGKFIYYDDILYVLLEDNWFYQYAYDPESPPVKAALDAGWSRGHFTLKITSRNLGYHKVDELIAPLSHEPGFSNVPTGADVRTFTMDQDSDNDIGGHKTFKQLLDSTVDAINNSGLDLGATARYDDTKEARAGDNLDAWKHGLINSLTFNNSSFFIFSFGSKTFIFS